MSASTVELERLLLELKAAEAQVDRIKAQMAAELSGVAAAPSVRPGSPRRAAPVPVPAPATQPSMAAKGTRTKKDPHSAIAPGTRGRQVVDAMQKLGRTVRVKEIAKAIGSPDATEETVGGSLYYLRNPKNAYVSSPKKGSWALTPKALAVLNP